MHRNLRCRHVITLVALGGLALFVLGCKNPLPSTPIIYMEPGPLDWTRPIDAPFFNLEERLKTEALKQDIAFDQVIDVCVANGGCRVDFRDTAHRAYRALIKLDGLVKIERIVELE
jgi:hypothetical protein